MISRAVTSVLIAAGWAVFLLAFVWPAAALILGSAAQGQAPDGGFTFTWRQWGLLWRSGSLSAAATVVCLILSLPGAYLIGQGQRMSRQPLVAASLSAVMLCPPMVFAFGWERILPHDFDPFLRCVAVWALWAWPIPAWVIGAGWSRGGRAVFEAALLSTSHLRAFIHVALPTLIRHIALSALILFVVFFSDYGVPHACGLTVYTTELLGWATSSSRLIDVVWSAILPTAVTLLVLVVVFQLWRRCDRDELVDASLIERPSSLLHLLVFTIFVASWLLPMGTLLVKLASTSVIVEALRIYGGDLTCSLAVAILSGIVAVGMGVGIAAIRLPSVPVVWAVIFGALPGALIGESLVAAYNRPLFGWLYDHWAIVALGYVARFGWIGLAIGMLVIPGRKDDLSAQARTDGATEADMIPHLFIPMNWALLCGGVAVIAALSVADVATSSLVRVPTFNPIAHVVIEKFHRFEDGMLISLSLCLVCAAIPPALLLAWALRGRS